MDFVPAPGKTEHTLIPYLGGRCDDRHFITYPSRVGWNVDRLRFGDVVGARLDADEESAVNLPLDDLRKQAASVVQTWLFFGLINEFLNGPEITPSRFTRTIQHSDGTSKKVLTTELLPEMVMRWCFSTHKLPSAAKEKYLQSRLEIINCSSSFLVDTLEAARTSIPFIPHEQRLCLHALAAYLNQWTTAVKLWAIEDPNLSSTLVYHTKNFPLIKQLLLEGRCPNILERVTRRLGVLGVYYLSLSGAGTDNKSHAGCSPQACAANMVDEENYTTVHWEPTCVAGPGLPKCDIFDIQIETNVIKIIDKGRIPLVDFSIDPDALAISGKPIVVPADAITRYAAVSHVWADGLGNPTCNALPRCQLSRLASQLQATISSLGYDMQPFLWIDTLCVPLRPEASRKAAILTMKETYMRAEFVWAFDGTLIQHRMPTSTEETLFRIFSSSWMTRLWTFQEAWLAWSLVFQFADRAVELDKLLKQVEMTSPADLLQPGASFDAARFFAYNLRPVFRKLWPSKRQGGWERPPNPWVSQHGIADNESFLYGDSHELFVKVWEPLRWRSTSHAKDIPLCIANVLGNDVKEILDESTFSGRMRAFWKTQDVITSDILFSRGPKVSQGPFRWAPLDLLHPVTQKSSIRPVYATAAAHITAAGLVVQGLPGFWLRLDQRFREKEGMIFQDRKTQIMYHTSLLDESGKHLEGCSVLNSSSTVRYALLLRDDLTPSSWTDVVLLSVGEECDAASLSASFLSLVRVRQVGGAWDTKLQGTDTPFGGWAFGSLATRSNAPRVEHNTVAEPIGSQQQWLIT
ncbi:hypothetical protein LTR37_000808 [Vermiconidia calcicola]|uniref:Uncharacterized protein n=1 Tax=Vermiconidia calcicola TaxID=1690605 RepID=A0ACC3NXZ9_9PEZI|nr:hypothetical protein LTR37_000808 [Vermiconidia calcicola]